MRRSNHDEPVLITSAPENHDDEFDRRRRRYALMMASRALCVLAAAFTYQFSVPLALAFVLVGAVLPWCAVIIANDRPPKKRMTLPPYGAARAEKVLPAAPDDRTVDG